MRFLILIVVAICFSVPSTESANISIPIELLHVCETAANINSNHRQEPVLLFSNCMFKDIYTTQFGRITDSIQSNSNQFTELLKRIDSLDLKITQRLDNLDVKMDNLDVKFTQRIDNLDVKMTQRMDNLDQKLDDYKWVMPVSGLIIAIGSIISACLAARGSNENTSALLQKLIRSISIRQSDESIQTTDFDSEHKEKVGAHTPLLSRYDSVVYFHGDSKINSARKSKSDSEQKENVRTSTHPPSRSPSIINIHTPVDSSVDSSRTTRSSSRKGG
jgi:hypothetical protein